ncbi:hypothetical protein SAMN05880582_108104 [Rhizobium sp. RU20A]|nr:hypothetical protein SAMN05880582_108104 [Rhizobium sp. RU20A]
MRHALDHAGKSGRRVVSAFIAAAFAQDIPEAASTQWRNVADQIRPCGSLRCPRRSPRRGKVHMAQFSMEIMRLTGSVLRANQQPEGYRIAWAALRHGSAMQARCVRALLPSRSVWMLGLKLGAPVGQKPLCGGERGRSRFRAGSEAFKGRHSRRPFQGRLLVRPPFGVPAPAGAAKCLQMFSFCRHCRHSPENALRQGIRTHPEQRARVWLTWGSSYRAHRAQQQSRSRGLVGHPRSDRSPCTSPF